MHRSSRRGASELSSAVCSPPSALHSHFSRLLSIRLLVALMCVWQTWSGRPVPRHGSRCGCGWRLVLAAPGGHGRRGRRLQQPGGRPHVQRQRSGRSLLVVAQPVSSGHSTHTRSQATRLQRERTRPLGCCRSLACSSVCHLRSSLFVNLMRSMQGWAVTARVFSKVRARSLLVALHAMSSLSPFAVVPSSLALLVFALALASLCCVQSGVRQYQNERGAGQIASVTLIDPTGSMKCVFFGESVDKLSARQQHTQAQASEQGERREEAASSLLLV